MAKQLSRYGRVGRACTSYSDRFEANRRLKSSEGRRSEVFGELEKAQIGA